MYSLLADGVKVFPKVEKKFDFLENQNINSCTKCPLSKARKRVVVSEQIESKKFFVLSDFPQKEDEDSGEVFSDKSSAQVLINLVQKLGISKTTYFSFALKCVPEKGIPDESLFTCSKHNLAFELQQTEPEVIFCFGYRALAALAYLDPNLASSLLNENQSQTFFHFQNHKIQLFFLSSSQDLQNFPHWRTQVWKQLERFSIQKR
jgi:uracil-DNA glycosylase family 4